MRNQFSRIGRWRKGILAVIMTLSIGLAAETPLAASEESNSASSLFDSKYTLTLGGFFPQVNTSLTLTSPRGGGTSISAEDDLGLDDTIPTAWINFNWRFQPRHQIQVEWFELDRKGSTTAGRSFTIFRTTVGVGASLDSGIDLNLARLTYGYSLIRNDNFDLSFLAGAHIATVKATITAGGNVSVNGVPLVGGSVTNSTSTKTLPLPHIGGEITYEFTPKLAGKLDLLAFALDISEYKGHIIEADALLAYQLTEHFGIGGGLKYFNLYLEYDKSDGGNVQYDYEFFGPAIFGYVSF